MISDDERREVAARLRKAIGLTEFAEALGFNWTDDSDWGWKDVSNLVADLIEPSCYLDTPQKVAEEMFGKMRHPTKEESDAYEATLKSMSVEIHPVDRDALLALADKVVADTEEDVRSEDLVPAWQAGEALRDVASKIREACGEEGA